MSNISDMEVFSNRILQIVADDLQKKDSVIRSQISNSNVKNVSKKVVNVDDTALSDKKKKEEIFRRAKMELVDVLRVYTNFNSLKMYLFMNSYVRVPLVWPSDFELVLAYDVRGYDESTLIKYADLVCCPEELMVLGYVKSTLSSAYNVEYEEHDIVILLGKVGRVYAHTTLFPDQICRVGDTIDNFLQKGLKRCLYAYFLAGCLQFHVPDSEIENVMTCADVLAFRDRHAGEKFVLFWPPKENILFHHRRDTFHFVTDPEIRSVLSNMCFFASFGLKCFSDGARVSLYVDFSGRIFGFNDNDLGGHLIFMASSFQEFRYFGVRNYYKHHTFYADRPQFVQRPICHFSSNFYLKTSRQGDCDLLFLIARADERTKYPDVGSHLFRCRIL
ncbi:tegument protein UL24 [macacine betaherpesvirus 9]|uniref:Tegument protein UL24 n=1 Tax=macacine betaherpesvirus 9 TaxID=2560568 RepID=A0A191S3U5_9BETA|nr:tegument protein UL24 [macacine betaherpesvirus 9]ANC96553.1 tegument protein UL24 [macacine betaherpesvirus 9]